MYFVSRLTSFIHMTKRQFVSCWALCVLFFVTPSLPYRTDWTLGTLLKTLVHTFTPTCGA